MYIKNDDDDDVVYGMFWINRLKKLSSIQAEKYSHWLKTDDNSFHHCVKNILLLCEDGGMGSGSEILCINGLNLQLYTIPPPMHTYTDIGVYVCKYYMDVRKSLIFQA